MHDRRLLGVALVGGLVAVTIATASSSCSQTPVNVPVRTFELPQKVAVVCMAAYDTPSASPLAYPFPVAEDNCGPVATGVNTSTLEFHLMATVTQLARGELAVVDLTAGNVIDEDKTTGGIQFIPVGAIPTDVVTAPDAQLTYVSSADPNKPAIYGIDNDRLLGDNVGSPPLAPLALTDLFACALPQPPGALSVVSLGPNKGYVLVAMLRAWAGQSAKIATIDPTPLIEGANQARLGVIPDAGAAGPFDAAVPAGSLAPCTVLGATELSGALPASWTPGPAWPDGVPYVDGGVNLADAEPSLGPGCTSPLEGGTAPAPPGADGGIPFAMGPAPSPSPNAMTMRTDVPVLYVSDGAVPVVHVIDLSDPTSPREEPPLLATSLQQPTRRVSVGPIAISPPTHDFHVYLYAGDTDNGSLMVYDVTDPASASRSPMVRPHAELNPFQPPDRIAFSSPVAALSFVTHDWPLPQQSEGANPVHQLTGLLCDPSPNAHPDGGAFVAGSDGEGLGAYYRADQTGIIQAGATVTTFPTRLRGVFGFATLSSGTIVAIDVDDWDAPCRRPDPMALGGQDGGVTGSLDVPEPAPSGPSDLDPYHVPLAYNPLLGDTAATTLESFFPVSAPNRLRSSFLLINDPTLGDHAPQITGGTQLYDSTGAPLSVGAGAAPQYPQLLPTPLPTGWEDPTYVQNPAEPDPAARASAPTLPATTAPGLPNTPAPTVRLSYEDPTTFVSQDWTVTYEGALPTVGSISLDMSTSDGYETLTMAATEPDAGAVIASTGVSSPGFCARGVEDWDVGRSRANTTLAAIAQAGLPAPGAGAFRNPTLPDWTSDYVEITDDLLPEGDAYWTEPSSVNDCWDPPLADPGNASGPSSNGLANQRFTACSNAFGALGMDAGPTPNESIADLNFGRDLPILQAYDDHLVLGRFGWYPTDTTGATVVEQPTNRVVVGPDPSNKPFLRFARCCFHHQAAFKVRSGGEWLTVGSVNGLLHHITTDPASGRCVPTCDPNDALKNARAPDVPWSVAPACAAPPSAAASIDRNSPLAMRNPMFSYVMWSGCTRLVSNDHTETSRDMQWKFSITGGFTPVTIALNGGSNIAVSPQSMRFIDSLGQLAIVDGEQQGLVLIDLNTLGFAHNPYY